MVLTFWQKYRFHLWHILHKLKHTQAPWLGQRLSHHQDKRKVWVALRPQAWQDKVLQKEEPHSHTPRRIKLALQSFKALARIVERARLARIRLAAQPQNLKLRLPHTPAPAAGRAAAALATRRLIWRSRKSINTPDPITIDAPKSVTGFGQSPNTNHPKSNAQTSEV